MSSKLCDMKLPVVLVLQILLCLFFGDYVPEAVKSFFYAVSLSTKTGLMAILPLIIFSFIAKSIADLGRGALTYIVVLLGLVCASNFIATCVSGMAGAAVLKNGIAAEALHSNHKLLTPLWEFPLPSFVSNDGGLFMGLLTGFIVSLLDLRWMKGKVIWLQQLSLLFLNKVFLRVIPVFILGFIFKIQHEGLLIPILRDYSTIFLLIGLCVYSYLFFLYGLANNFKQKRWLESIRNMLPAALTGFSAMSSAAALPLILTGSEKNVEQPEIVRGAVPMVVNIHLIGCDFTIPMLALAIMISFGFDLPALTTYLTFAGYFVLAKFAVAAVPAGGIIVMLPVLEKHLGFTPEMLSLITALYILFDPLVTSANVMGNGGFVMLFNRLYNFLKPGISAK